MKTASDRLVIARTNAGYASASEAAARFNWPAPTYLSHENGTRGLRLEVAKKYARAFGVSATWLLTGEEQRKLTPLQVEVTTLPVVGEVAAGVWLEEVGFEEPHEHIPVVPDSRFAGMRQFALRVRGPSMNLLINEPEYVVCVDAIDMGREPKNNDIVVVTRTRRAGHLRETTLKQVEIKGRTVELWPRSSDPKFQTPVVLNDNEGDDVSVEITAYVIAVHRPLL